MKQKPKNRNYNSWEDLIEDKTHREGDCLIWDCGTHRDGYPMVRWGDGATMVQVARIQAEHHHGIVLKGRDQRVKNRCGNRRCVEPTHYIVADRGTEEWKCIAFKYDEAQQAEMVRVYNEYKHPNTGTKNGGIQAVKDHFGGKISKITIVSVLKKHGVYVKIK